jgi:hypothetical protein
MCYLSREKCTEYVLSVLSTWGRLGQSIAVQQPRWEDGEFHVLLPSGTVAVQLDDLKRSAGIRAEASADSLIALLHQVSDMGTTLVWDDPYLRLHDPVLARLPGRRFAKPQADAVIFVVSPQSSIDDIEDAHLAAETASGCVVVGTLASISWAEGEAVFMESLCSNVDVLSISAFDGDSYLVWVRTGAGLDGLVEQRGELNKVSS